MLVTIDMTGVESLMRTLSADNARKAVKNSVKQLYKDGFLEARTHVEKYYNMRQGELDRYIDKPRTSNKNGEISVSVKIKRSNFNMFNFIQSQSVSSSLKSKKKKTGRVVVKIKRGGQAHVFDHAFVMLGKNGNIGIFNRIIPKTKTSTGKDKIVRINTLGPTAMFQKEGFPIFKQHIEDHAMEVIQKKIFFYIRKQSRGK